MTLMEAIGTNRRFKRPQGPFIFIRGRNLEKYQFSKEEALANDWEVEPEPEKQVTITRSDLGKAATRVFYITKSGLMLSQEQLEALAGALGL